MGPIQAKAYGGFDFAQSHSRCAATRNKKC